MSPVIVLKSSSGSGPVNFTGLCRWRAWKAVSVAKAIEFQEAGIHVLIHRLVVDAGHLPKSVDAIEKELLHHFLAIEHLLYNHMVDGGILHQIHLLAVVEDERVVVLAHKEMLHPPMFLLNLLLQLVVVINRKRKLIRLICNLRFAAKLNTKSSNNSSAAFGIGVSSMIFSVESIACVSATVVSAAVESMARRRLLVCASHRGEANDGKHRHHDCYQR